MSGITITDKRKQVVDFSKPYFLAHQLILTDKSVKINKLSDLSKGSVAVVSGSAGDVAASKAFYARNNPDKHFNMTRDPAFEEQYFGIAVKKGNQKLIDKINAGLEKVIASGEYNKIYRKWFGTDAPKLPQ